MKIVSYNPEEIQNVPALMNVHLLGNDGENFVMFIHNNIIENVVDKQKLCGIYQSFMQRFNLPFAMFPYYLHFNKILNGIIDMPNARATVMINKTREVFDIIGQAAYGMLIVDKRKLDEIEFRFDERYPKAMYIQDLMNACFLKKIWISNTYYIDVHDSWKMFKENITTGYSIPGDVFIKEKQEFIKNYTPEIPPQTINDFIQILKSNYGDVK